MTTQDPIRNLPGDEVPEPQPGDPTQHLPPSDPRRRTRPDGPVISDPDPPPDPTISDPDPVDPPDDTGGFDPIKPEDQEEEDRRREEEARREERRDRRRRRRDTFTTEDVGETTIPGGAKLIRITNPEGSDEKAIFVLQYEVFGVPVTFEVGNKARVTELFGSIDNFERYESFSQKRYDAQEFISAGSVDEVVGATESLGSQIERAIRASNEAGSIPEWMLEDRRAMTMVVLSEQEGWSQDRLYDELSGTRSFRRRFGDFSAIEQQTGTDNVFVNVQRFLANESALRDTLVQFRGSVGDRYLADLVQNGWQQAEVVELLELEKQMVENPDSLANINELLQAQGLDIQLTADDFIDFMRDARRSDQEGFTPSELFTTINDALRQSALTAAGVNISDELALELGAGDTGQELFDPTFFQDQAAQIAAITAANFRELEAEKFGLNRDDVIRYLASDGEGDPNTRKLLERFARDRGIAARGFDRGQTFVDASGRLRAQGFADLTN